MLTTPIVARCSETERQAALDVLFRRAPRGVRSELVADALSQADRGEIDLSGLWIARRLEGNGRVLGAMLTQRLAGRAAAVWAPEVEPSWRRAATARLLLTLALEDLKEGGCLLAQALVDASTPRQAVDDLTAAGMPWITDLVTMRRSTATPLEVPHDPFEWLDFSRAGLNEFRRVIEATYVGSLDVPELTGARSLDHVLEGHQGSKRFEPALWQVGRIPHEPDAAAVVLVAPLPDHDAREIAYLGLTPQARGRGLGRAALARALLPCGPSASLLELAVDVRNTPAVRLYEGAGFVAHERRGVHLIIFEAKS